MDRAHSVPVEGNVFWSDKARQEHRLAALRPMELPSPVDSNQPIADGSVATGKGRGDSTYSLAAGNPGMGNLGCYETPPSNRGDDSGRAPPVRAQTRTQGMMPDEEVPVMKRVRRTRGQVPTDDDHYGRDQEQPQPNEEVGGDLQRDLERAMVEDLRDRNEQLQRELDELRASRQRPGDSSSSWSVIQPKETEVKERGRSERRTPRRQPRKDAEPKVPRFTPKGGPGSSEHSTS